MVLWTLLLILSILVGFASVVVLFGIGINHLLKKVSMPSFTFKFPLLKIILISFISSIVLFITSITGFAVTAPDDFLNANNNNETNENLNEENEESRLLLEKEQEAAIKEQAEKEAAEKKAQAEEAAKQKEKEEAKAKEKAEQEEQAKKEAEEKNKTLSGMTVHFIDVGQADAALIQYSDKAILIDSGNWNGNQTVNYLNSVGIKEIDIIVGTHPHADHIGQIDKVIDAFEVGEVWMAGSQTNSNVFSQVIDAIERNDIGYDEPRAGDHYQVGDLSIDVLSPTGLTSNLNNDSVVMKLTYGSVSFLFTGDAESSAESQMVNSGQNLQSTILKVGHHGSDTSSTQAFIDKVNPKAAIISVGQNSQYNHPNESVLNRLKDKGIDLYATSAHGTIVVTTDGSTYTINASKQGEIVAGDAKTTKTKTATKPKNDTSKKQDNKQVAQSTNTAGKSETKAEGKPKTKPKTEKPKQEKPKSSGSCVNINTASESEVQAIKHIGEVRAKDLIANRPYHSVDDLTKIKGIAAGRLADIKAEGIACVK